MTKTSKNFYISKISYTAKNGTTVWLDPLPTKEEFDFENYEQQLTFWFGDEGTAEGLKVGQTVRLSLSVVEEAK